MSCPFRPAHLASSTLALMLVNYFICFGLVALSTADHIENALASLWFVGYSKRTPVTLLLVWFWMKQSQRRGAAILFKMLVNYIIYWRPCRYGSLQSHWKPCGQPLVHRVVGAYTRRFVASLVLDEAIPTPRSGHFIQNATKLDYLLPLMVLVIVKRVQPAWFKSEK
jgi:hypothetical protein